MLEIKNLNVRYKGDKKEVWAVREVSLMLEANTSYGIVGESGSGKTTFAMALIGQLPESALADGKVYYKGKNLLELDENQMKKYKWTDLSVVFQASMNAFSPVHKIKETFQDVYKSHFPRTTNQKIKENVLGIFYSFNLQEEVYNSYPHELSGGMLQRVTIVLSLILAPSILVMDEATTALDVINERQILETIKKYEHDKDMLRINITHDISVVYTSCKEVIVMYGGYVLETGSVKEVFLKPYHPYTKDLLNSYPDLNKKSDKLKAIPGSLPDLSKEYEGCIYYDRCENRMQICKSKMPDLYVYGKRACACHRRINVENE